MTTLGNRIADRYRLDAPLGEGSGGRVFAALDEHTGSRVAVKLLAATPSRGFDVERGALRSVRHPHLLSVLDAGRHAPGAFLVTELMEGGDLVGVAKPLDATTLHALTTQTLEALAFLHAQGILHGDVKSENVFVQSLDPPLFRLGDFGLARLHAESGGATRGSPAFMPPEVIRGEPSDERSDLYALGCTLYECAFGELPFADADVRQALLRHLNETPARLSDAGGVNVRLVRLLRSLLAKEPASRPMDARAALAAWRGEEAAVPRWVPARLGVLIGRDAELAALECALADPTVAAVTLEGPAGVGKTRLLREFALRAELRGIVAVWLTATEWSMLSSDALSNDDTRSLAAARAATLKRRLGLAPWILLMDDFDALPAPLRDAFAFFLRDVASDPTPHRLVIAAARGDAHAPALEALAAGGFTAPQTIELQAWSREQTEVAASALFGARRLHSSLVELVQSASGGVPSEIEAVAQRLVEDSLLRTDAQGALTATAIVRIGSIVEARSERLVRSLAACTAEQREVLELLTTLRSPASSELLTALRFDAVAQLPILQRLGLTTAVRQPDGTERYTTAHAGVREWVTKSLDPAARKRFHDRIADQLEAEPELLASEDAKLHRVRGFDWLRSRAALAEIESRPQSSSQPELMRECLEVALAGWPSGAEPDARNRIVFSLAEVYIRLVDEEALDKHIASEQPRLDRESMDRMRILRARIYLAKAKPQLALKEIAPVVQAEGEAPSELVCDALVIRGEAFGFLVEHENALADFARVLPHAVIGSRLLDRLLDPFVYNLCEVGRLEEAEALLHQVINQGNHAVSSQCLAAAIGRLGHVAFKRGDMQRAFDHFADSYSRCEQIGDRYGMLRSLNGLGVIACELGRFNEARESFRRALDFSRRLGDAFEVGLFLNNLAQLLSTLGKYREALEFNDRASILASNRNLNTSTAAILVTRAEIFIAVGLEDSSRQVLGDLLASNPPELYRAQAALLGAEIEIRAENYPEARRLLIDSEVRLKACSVEDELVVFNLLMARLDWSLGDGVAAITRLRDAREYARSKHLILTTARCDCYLAEFLAEMEAPEASAHAETGLASSRAMQVPEFQWQCERALGRIAFLRGDLGGALVMYRGCLEILQEISADMPAEMANGYLAVRYRRRIFDEIQAIRGGSRGGTTDAPKAT